jgi:chromate transporter
MALSILYALFGQTGPVAALFFGLKAAVLVVVVQAVLRVGSRALKNPAMVAIAAGAFLGIYAFKVSFPLIILAAGLIGFIGGRMGLSVFAAGGGHGPTPAHEVADADTVLGEETPDHARPDLAWALRIAAVLLALWLTPVAGLGFWLGWDNAFAQIAVFFSKMAVVTFGGAYAVLAYVAQEAVQTYGWLRPGEMLDGLGLAETTPGPLIMVNWIFLGAPFVEALRGARALNAALAAITAAVVGVILNLAIWFSLHVLFAQVREARIGPLALDLPVLSSLNLASLALAAAAAVAAFRFKVGVIPLLLACAAAGAVAHVLGGLS